MTGPLDEGPPHEAGAARCCAPGGAHSSVFETRPYRVAVMKTSTKMATVSTTPIAIR